MKGSLRPRVIANFALTADGKVSTKNRTASGFTSTADKDRLREIRALGDAVMVSASTAKADRMSMTLSTPALRKGRTARGLPAEPLRIVISHSGASLNAKLNVFHKAGAPIIAFAGGGLPPVQRQRLAGLCDLWIFEKHVAIDAVLQILKKEYRVRTLVCEGGPRLLRALLEIKALDELRITMAPLVFGGAQAPTLTGLDAGFLPKGLRGRLAKMEAREGECYLTYRF